MRTKTEKQVSEELKPIEEQKYWILGDYCKKEWLKYHKLNKFTDIIFPIIQFFLSIIILILLSCAFIFARGASLAILIFVFILYLPLFYFMIYRMVKNKKGFFIYRYWHLAKEIKDETESEELIFKQKTKHKRRKTKKED